MVNGQWSMLRMQKLLTFAGAIAMGKVFEPDFQ